MDSRDEATGERLDNLEDPFRLKELRQGLPKGAKSITGDLRTEADDGGEKDVN
jgi:hypothetical protein